MNELSQKRVAAMPAATAETLRLNGIRRIYGQGATTIEVLKGADLSIRAGEAVALVGPSGAGKSTLLHIAGLLESPSAGWVKLCGADCSALNDAERTRLRRRDIGFVYQAHRLLPEFTAMENVVLPQRIAGLGKDAARERAEALLVMMGLAARTEHRPSELSGGEQQRVAIARAVANAPQLLLADEPTGNLDPKTAGRVFEALMRIVRQTGLAALIATHNYDLAAKMDRTVTLADGRIRD